LGSKLLGYRSDDLPREVIAEEDGRPIYKFSTDSPLRTTTGDLEALPAFAGQVTGLITTIPNAADLVSAMVRSAHLAFDRLETIRRGVKR
jgi:nitronate monooxygenase